MAESPSPQPNFAANRPGRLMAKAPKLRDARGTLHRLGTYLVPRWKSLLAVFFLAATTTGVTIVGTRLNGYAVDAYILKGDMRGLAILCMALSGIYLVGVATTYLQNILMVRAAQRTAADLRRDLFGHMQKLSLGYYDTHSSGDLMSRLTNDVDNINSALSQNVVQLFTSVIMISGMLAAMLTLSPHLTLVCLVTTPVTYLASRSFLKAAQRFYVVQQRELGSMNGYIEEMVSGQKVVRLFSREAAVQAAFEEVNGRLVASSWRALSISGVIGPCNNFVNNFAYLLVAVAGGAAIIRGYGAVTVGVVFSFLLYMRNFTNPINNILTLVNTLQLALASAERVFEIMNEPEEHDEEGAVAVEAIHGDIELRSVDFSYVPGKPVLHEVDIAALAGQTVAIVGPTGSGKTTIINLLTKFYSVDGGEILVDGRDIRAITSDSLRKSVAVVLQETFLFSDTIRENIRYGRPSATDAEVENAARQAYAHEFIAQLPAGYDTVLADNGQNLSQGQRQLLGIARAMISRASVLILDEATSSIDTRTEILIQEALLELMRGKTSFVIAHRLSTIRNADVILVIDGGRVVERGTHDQLIAAGGSYANLYESQFKGFAI